MYWVSKANRCYPGSAFISTTQIAVDVGRPPAQCSRKYPRCNAGGRAVRSRVGLRRHQKGVLNVVAHLEALDVAIADRKVKSGTRRGTRSGTDQRKSTLLVSPLPIGGTG